MEIPVQYVLGRGVGHDEGARPRRLAFDDPGYLDVADFELVHSILQFFHFFRTYPDSLGGRQTREVQAWRLTHRAVNGRRKRR